MTKTLVLGLGNTLLSDEGAGVYVVRELEKSHPPSERIHFLDGGTLSFTLAGPIEEADELIVVDTAELHAEPGTVRVFTGDEMDAFVATGKKSSVHEVSLMDLMAIAHLEDHLPARRALVGIQPQLIDWGDAPSGAVSKAIPLACKQVVNLVGQWQS